MDYVVQGAKNVLQNSQPNFNLRVIAALLPLVCGSAFVILSSMLSCHFSDIRRIPV